MSTNKLTVVNNDLSEYDEESTFELQDFPMPIEGTNSMEVDKFLKYPNFPIQREYVNRAKKAVVRLSKPMHKHAEVDLLKYTGPTTSKPAFFQNGATYVLDGNTRQYCWKTHKTDRQRVNSNVASIPVPKNVAVRVYELDDAYEACKLYYIIDSVDAVETKADKVTGAFRASNLLDRFKNKKLKRGQIGGALTVACPYGGKSAIQVAGVKDLMDQVRILQEPLIQMDKLNAPGEGHFHVLPATGVAILAGLEMDCSNEWFKIVDELSNVPITKIKVTGIEDYSFSSKNVEALVRGNIENVLGKHNALPYDIGYGQYPFMVLNYLAYCWTCIIKGIEVAEDINLTTIGNSYIDLVNSAHNID